MPAAGSSKRFFRKRVTIAGAEPKTAGEINAEYERLERDLRLALERQITDAHREHYERLQELREQRAAALAEVEDKDDTHQQTTD